MKNVISMSVVLGTLMSLSLQAQSIDKQTFSSSGGVLAAGGESVSYTMGESIVGTIVSGESLAQGFWAGVASEAMLDIENLEEDSNGFKIFPNPVSEELFVSIPATFEGDASLFSIEGKEIQKLGLQPGNEQSFDLSEYASGVYLLVFESSYGRSTTLRIIKN